jgi:hypothetical protein
MKSERENHENKKKIPLICAKILQELERVAPEPVHVKDLAFKCNTSSQKVNRKIAVYPEIFEFVEKIQTDVYTQYRLNIGEKMKKYQENIKQPLLIRVKKRIFLRKK